MLRKFIEFGFWSIVAFSAIYVAYLFVWLLSNWITSLFAGVNDTVKAASITALVTVTLFLLGRYFEQSRDRKLKVNAEKIAVYKRFFDFYFDMHSYEKVHGKPKENAQILKELVEFQKDLVFWGSDQVLRAFLKFKEDLDLFTSRQNGSAPSVDLHENLAMVMKSVAALLVAMRKDIGYSFTVFNARDLARLQLSSDDDTRRIFEFL